MGFTRFKILVIVCLFFPKSSYGQHYDFVKILQGQGIVYNNDSILLNKTTVKELHKKLKIKYTSNPNVFLLRLWDGKVRFCFLERAVWVIQLIGWQILK